MEKSVGNGFSCCDTFLQTVIEPHWGKILYCSWIQKSRREARRQEGVIIVMYELLKSRCQIGNVTLKNRIVKPAAQGSPGPTTDVPDSLVRFCGQQAAGGAAMVVMGCVNVSKRESEEASGHATLESDDKIKGMCSIAQAIHDNGAKACVQLSIYASHGKPKDPNYGWRCVSLAGVKNDFYIPVLYPEMRGKLDQYKEYTTEEIHEIVEFFGDAAVRAKTAGFDMVEVHGSNLHGLNLFLTPLTNQRTDEYGGSLENRFRIMREIIENIQKKCGKRYPIVVRLQTYDRIPAPGNTVEDTIWMCQQLEAMGVASISLSNMTDGQPMMVPQGDNIKESKIIKEKLHIPVMVSGSLNEPNFCEKVLEDGCADLLCMGRALYADPSWPKKICDGDVEDIRPCIRCNECVNQARYYFKGNMVCSVNPTLGKETELPLIPAEKPKKIAVIGGGPAGMEAALTASRRGHHVVLFEKNELGGLVNVAAIPPFKKELIRLIDYYKTQIEKSNVEVRYEEATVDKIRNFDSAIVAAGGTPARPPVPGLDQENVHLGIDVLRNNLPVGDNLLIVGAGNTGIETAIMLAQQGKKVTIVDAISELLPREFLFTKNFLLTTMKKNNVTVMTETFLQSVEGNTVNLKSHDKEFALQADDIILTTGMRPDLSLYDELQKIDGLGVYFAGDSENPKQIFEAVHSGFAVGRLI